MNNLIFEKESARLLSSLRAITEGGQIERLEPIGSSSAPGNDGSGVVDIGLLAWPFPVNQDALAGLGYYPVDDPSDGQPGIQRFMDGDERVQLWLVSADQTFFENAVLIRDHLRIFVDIFTFKINNI